MNDPLRFLYERHVAAIVAARPAPRSAALTLPGLGAGEQGHGPLFRVPVPGALSGSGDVPPFVSAPTLART